MKEDNYGNSDNDGENSFGGQIEGESLGWWNLSRIQHSTEMSVLGELNVLRPLPNSRGSASTAFNTAFCVHFIMGLGRVVTVLFWCREMQMTDGQFLVKAHLPLTARRGMSGAFQEHSSPECPF
jgi:hypothetical protein